MPKTCIYYTPFISTPMCGQKNNNFRLKRLEGIESPVSTVLIILSHNLNDSGQLLYVQIHPSYQPLSHKETWKSIRLLI